MSANNQQNRIPETSTLRNDLADRICRTMQNGENTVFRVATSVGKTHTVATTHWSRRPDLTGGKPVVHLHPTRKARDDAVQASREDGLRAATLYGREEHSSILSGQYDKDTSINGTPVSEWVRQRCTRDGFQYRDAVRLAEQEINQSPPWRDEGDENQWQNLLPLDDTRFEIIHATHQFAYVPPLRDDTVIVFDERPSFTRDPTEFTGGLTQDRIRRAVTTFLQETSAGITYEDLIALGKLSNRQSSASIQLSSECFDYEPDFDWFVRNDEAHVLSPAFAKAIYKAKQRSNGRRVGTATYSPPRLHSSQNSGSDTVRVTIVLDEDNTIRTCRVVPELSNTRAVIGLDAFPVLPLWELNTGLVMDEKSLLSTTKRRQWRQDVRGLHVVQVGNNANYYTNGNLNDSKVQCLIRELHEEYGAQFNTCITAKSVHSQVEKLMRKVGIPNPRVMHYGEQNSRNDFGAKDIGLVLGCIDPGDDWVMDRIAELDLDAEPKRTQKDCSHCNGGGCSQCDGTGRQRAPYRVFTGSDAGTAEEINDAVRKGNVSQAICRYARNPGDPNDSAKVFVATNAFYTSELRDKEVPGVTKVFGKKQREIIEFAREQTSTTAIEMEDNTSAKRNHVTETLNLLVEEGYASVDKEAGIHGRHIYRVDTGTPSDGVVHL